MTAVTSVKQAPVAYMFEFGIATALFVGAMLARNKYASHASSPSEHLALIALPIVPVWLMLLAVVRHYRRIDEFAKLVLVRNLALAAGLTACIVTSYGLLSDVGLRPLTIDWAWPVMAVCWGLLTALSEWRAR